MKGSKAVGRAAWWCAEAVTTTTPGAARRKVGWLVPLCAVMLVAGVAQAAEEVKISGAWVRATVPGQPVGAAYMELRSSRRLTLSEVSSPVASSAEIHTMVEDQGVMKMRAVEKVELQPGKPVAMAPGGMHVMLFGLNRQLVAGSKTEITLKFTRSDGSSLTRTVQAPVKPLESVSPKHEDHDHH